MKNVISRCCPGGVSAAARWRNDCVHRGHGKADGLQDGLSFTRRGDKLTRPDLGINGASIRFNPRKSATLSDVAASNPALCSSGKTGDHLHYRGADSRGVANTFELEEIADLLVYGELPNKAERTAYESHLKSLRGLTLTLHPDSFINGWHKHGSVQ